MRSLAVFFAIAPLACAVANNDSGLPDGGLVDGSIGPSADASPPGSDASSSACAQALEALDFDFESGAEGFVHNRMPEVASSTATWTFDHWQQGTANLVCPSGSKCWGTHLSGNYIQCQRAYLVSPPIDLSACGSEGKDVQLLFEHYYDFWTGEFGGTWFDGGLVEISSDGTNWQSAALGYPGTIAINPDMGGGFECVEKNNFYVHGKPGFVGSSAGWVSAAAIVPAAMASVTFQVRFVYGAGVSSMTTNEVDSMLGTGPGWYVDNLRFQ